MDIGVCKDHDPDDLDACPYCEIDSLRAEVEARQWQPIETMPQGEHILYYPPIKNSRGGYSHEAWVTIGHNIAPRRATHWMPLPAHPAAAPEVKP